MLAKESSEPSLQCFAHGTDFSFHCSLNSQCFMSFSEVVVFEALADSINDLAKTSLLKTGCQVLLYEV